MEKQEVLLKDYTDQEKGAYLGAIASLATADQEASEEELAYIIALAEAAGLSGQQTLAVEKAAKEITGEELMKCLDILKNSQLKYSLVTDLISFAQADNHYSDEEKANIQKISHHLGINQQQFSFLDQFVNKTSNVPNVQEEINKPGFLSSNGLTDPLKKSGLDIASVTRGFLGMVAPMVLAGLVSRAGRGRNRMGGMGGLGGMAGGGGMLGGGTRSGGGLGSLISVLSGGRGYRNTGGLLGRLMGF